MTEKRTLFAIRAGDKPEDVWGLDDIFPWQEGDDQYADFVGTRDECIEHILWWRDVIAAERQATVPTDEALVTAVLRTMQREIPDTMIVRCDAVSVIKVVRQALGAWPQVPEGWRLDNVTFRGWTNGYEASYRATVANDALNTKRIDVGPTPAAALQAAIDQIGGAE